MGHVHEISLFLTLLSSRVARVEIVTMMNSKIAQLLRHHRRTCTNTQTPSVAKEINNNILRDDLWDELRLCVQNVDLPNEENVRASESVHVSMVEIVLRVVDSFEFRIQIFKNVDEKLGRFLNFCLATLWWHASDGLARLRFAVEHFE